MGTVTEIFRAVESGDRQALDRLVDLVYDELKRVAQATPKGPNDSLTTTALAHEVVLRLRLLEPDELAKFAHRAFFFGAVAHAMREILIDHARKRRALKRGGGAQQEELSAVLDKAIDAFESGLRLDILDLHDALDELERSFKRPHEVAVLRFFCGLTEDEVKDCLGVSKATVQGDWRFAKAWLRKRLSEG